MALPLSAIPKPITLYETSLSAKILSTDTSLTLSTATDDAGNAISGVVGLTCDGEVMIGTKSGTTVTGLLRGIDPQDGTSEVTALKADHQRGAVIKITSAPFLNIVYRLLNGAEGFPNQLKYVTTGYPTPVNDYDIPTKAYVLSVAGASPVSQNRVVVSGTAGETLTAGNLVYFKAADARWWKCDADTAATVDNIIMGIAQGAGTAGAAITSGVLVYGRDTNNSGLTDGSTYYAGNTAGAISSSAGTVEVTVGAADDDGYLFFAPRYNQQLTEDQQDALAGTSGTPSASNLFVTANDVSATAAASKVVRSNGSSKIAEAYLNLTDAQAGVLTGGYSSDATTYHVHKNLGYRVNTFTTTGTTSPETLLTYTLPAGRLGTKGALRVRWAAQWSGSGYTAAVDLKFGSTVLNTVTLANPGGASGTCQAEFLVYNDSATGSQKWVVSGGSGLLQLFYTGTTLNSVAANFGGSGTASIDTTAQQTITLVSTKSNSSMNLNFYGLTLEVMDAA